MFTLIIRSLDNEMEMGFNEYTIAIGSFFQFLGSSLLQKEEKEFILTLNDTIIREVAIANGKVILDNTLVDL